MHAGQLWLQLVVAALHLSLKVLVRHKGERRLVRLIDLERPPGVCCIYAMISSAYWNSSTPLRMPVLSNKPSSSSTPMPTKVQ